MGNVSIRVCVAAIGLIDKIKNEYHCVPQGVVTNGGIGFNVGGREVGRVMDGKDSEIDVLFYASGSERTLPVFA